MNMGFDNSKYLQMQSEQIKNRISQFGNKLYLEFGGKLFDDYHASRVLPGFAPDSKLQMLLQLKDQAEIIIVINADHIVSNKMRGDLGITYQQDVFRLIDAFRNAGLYVGSVCITHFAGQKAAEKMRRQLEQAGIPCYYHYPIQGYPTDTSHIVSEEGFGKNDYIKTSRPLVVVTAPGPGSGKMATCLSQLYHENLNGVEAGYAKYETFPVWNLPLKDPVNLAYEAATADLKDVNMIDPYHQEAYGKIAVNYNRDVEIFPVLDLIFKKIKGSSPYKSPTDMGVNMAGFCISDMDAVHDASHQEIIRRWFSSRTRVIREQDEPGEMAKQDLLMNQCGLQPEDREAVKAARQRENETGTFCAAIELPDGTMVTGKNGPLMGPCAASIMNALKYLADIEDPAKLIAPEDFIPIQKLKTTYFGSQNPRLHTDEMLIALSLSAKRDPKAQKALEMLPKLAGSQAHVTCALADVDKNLFSSLGLQTTWEEERR